MNGQIGLTSVRRLGCKFLSFAYRVIPYINTRRYAGNTRTEPYVYERLTSRAHRLSIASLVNEEQDDLCTSHDSKLGENNQSL